MINAKFKVAFLWDGFRLHNGKRFRDGLWAALEHLKKRGHIIQGFEPDDETRIHAFQPDVLLYWGALIENSKPLVEAYPYKKAMCFAGGPIEEHHIGGFNLYFVESKISEQEFTKFNQPWMRAFGINEELYQPEVREKKYDAAFWGTFALWKRPELFARAMGDRGIWIGIKQPHERECFEICEELGVKIFDELPRAQTLEHINSSYTALNTANFWGGGQRMTLEAMACNIPVIAMTDSPKNAEYIEESGFGLVVKPDIETIKLAIEQLKETKINSREYILSKWTSVHYANALEIGLLSL